VGLALLTLSLVFLYGNHRVGLSGHTPRIPLIVAGIGFFGFLYGDIYYSNWFSGSTTNDTLAAVLTALAYAAIGAALVVAAALRLGPALRLSLVAASLVIIGVCEGFVNGFQTLTAHEQLALYGIEAAAALGIAGVLLASSLASSPTSRPARSAAPRWAGAMATPAAAGPPASPGWGAQAPPSGPAPNPGRPTPRFCSVCGAGLAPGVRFCAQCGHPV
jgi:hypothetical protein